MMRMIAQLVFSLALVEFVPTTVPAVERATLPQAEERSLLQEAKALVLASDLPEAEAVAPRRVDPTRLGVVTTAASVLVVDEKSSTVLFEKNADEVRPIGSMTKLLAAAVFLDGNPDLGATDAVREEDLRSGGHDHLFVDDTMSVRNLLMASLVGSDNPATVALMRLSQKTPEVFAARMNELASAYGMTHSFFVEPTGLDPRNVSTARDIVRLLDNVLAIPTISDITKMSVVAFDGVSGRSYRIPTTNALLTSYLNAPPFDVAGGKTGYLPSAGYGLGVRVRDASGHGVETVVLGSATPASRFSEVKGLTQWAFDVYQWPDEL